MKKLVVFVIKIYQMTVSPILLALFGHACRFTPTCSEYAKGAIIAFGVKKGMSMSLKRVSKCHPFYHGASFDPVPTK